VLQARIFSYADAHRHRLGTHYEALPVNAPQCPVHTYHKDGQLRFFPNNPNQDAYYEPNSFNGQIERPDLAGPPLTITGDADRFDHRDGNDDYAQPRALFNLFDAGQKSRLFSNIADAMQGVPEFIIERQLGHFAKVHPQYAAGVRETLAARAGGVGVEELVWCEGDGGNLRPPTLRRNGTITQSKLPPPPRTIA